MAQKIIYIANARMPTEKAHGLQIVKNCQALAEAGADVLLIVPKRRNHIAADPFSYYGIKKNFQIEFLPVWDLVWWGWIGFLLAWLSFTWVLRRRPGWDDPQAIIFSRDIFSAWVVSFQNPRVYFEMHYFPERHWRLWRLWLRQMQGVISTNRWKAKMAEKFLGFPKARILVAPNGFDETEFLKEKYDRATTRRILGLDAARPLAIYTGHLYGWKGAPTLAQAASLLSEVMFIFVGGTKKDVDSFRRSYKLENIKFTGHKPHSEIPRYLAVADVLVLPNSGKSPESQTSTSPLKLFEYMASGVPIVASDLPAIREVVDDSMVFFSIPDDPRSIAETIQAILENPKAAEGRASRAKAEVSHYTLKNRAKSILAFISPVRQSTDHVAE